MRDVPRKRLAVALVVILGLVRNGPGARAEVSAARPLGARNLVVFKDVPGHRSPLQTQTRTRVGPSADRGFSIESKESCGQSYGYDMLGRRVSVGGPGGLTILSYDVGSELTSMVGPGGTTSFTYDTAGRRVGSAGPGGGSTFL